MSDTPRTDKRLREIFIGKEDSCCAIYVKINGKDSDCGLVDADFARDLERENNETRRKLEELQKEVQRLRMDDCEKMGGLE